MINFLYTHTYYDSTQAGPDDISLFEANSQQEIELQIQHLDLQTDTYQTTSQIVPKADEETDEVMRATALKSLLFHVKINSIADYYDIPELRRCANTKVQNVLNTSWSPCNFPVILQEAFNSGGDKELRNILSEAMAAHIDELVELGEEIAPPEAISDFAYDVLRRLVARIKNLESQPYEAKREARYFNRGSPSRPSPPREARFDRRSPSRPSPPREARFNRRSPSRPSPPLESSIPGPILAGSFSRPPILLEATPHTGDYKGHLPRYLTTTLLPHPLYWLGSSSTPSRAIESWPPLVYLMYLEFVSARRCRYR